MLKHLHPFLIRAKKATYVAAGANDVPSRHGSHDLSFHDGDWAYFGGTDFLGRETMWLRDEPVWSMLYYGHILRPDLIDGERAGETISVKDITACALDYMGGLIRASSPIN